MGILPGKNQCSQLTANPMASRFPAFSQSLAQEQTTRRIWYGLATVHDIEEYDCITEGQFYQQVFTAHFGQLAVIFFWISGILFHVGWQGNFNTWTKDVIQTIPIAHTILDPHFSEIALTAFGHNSSNNPVNNAYSGIYHWWFTIGMRTEQDLFIGAIFLLTCAVLALTAAQVHQQMVPDINWFKNAESRLNHHLAASIGTSSLAWAGHIVHIAIPAARGQYVRWHNLLETAPKQGLAPFFTGNWIAYNGKLQIGNALNVNDKDESLLTFIGGLNPATGSLWLTDIAHHHLAIAVLFIIAGHMYRTNFGIGHSIQSIMNKHIPGKHFLGNGHFNLHAIVSNSLNLQLALALAAISTVTSLTAQHMYALPAFAFIGLDIITQATLYTHHQYIAGILMMGAFAHGSIFLVKDYSNKDAAVNVLARVIAHKEAIISHLSWVCLLVGFHTLGIYVHNDVMIAFGSMDKQILIEPIFAQCIQSTHGKTAIGWSLLLSSSNAASSIASKGIWLSGWMDAINNASNPLFLDIGPGDFLVHHAIALGLHTTSLIVIKGALDARGSKLMPDKKEFGYSFPCDGPGRGGTCDISAWDAV